MKIFIISDLHANLEVLSALPRDYRQTSSFFGTFQLAHAVK
jgi:hypothetical protein